MEEELLNNADNEGGFNILTEESTELTEIDKEVDYDDDLPEIDKEVDCDDDFPENQNNSKISVEINDNRDKENLQLEKRRPVRFPLTRVKNIIKSDPECTKVSSDAIFLITKATELFVDYMGKETVKHTQIAKRKTILRRDVDAAIENIPHLCFLEGALE